MAHSKIGVSAVAVLALCVGVLVWVGTREEKQSKSNSVGNSSASDAELDRIRARLRHLESERPLGKAQTQVASRPSSNPLIAEEPPVLADSEEKLQSPVPGRDSEVSERHRRWLDGQLRDEWRDEDWAPRIEGMVKAALDEEQFAGTRLVRLECGATMCRVDVEHDSPETSVGFHERLAETDVGGEGEGAWSLNTEVDGVSHTLYYVAREGHPEVLSGPSE